MLDPHSGVPRHRQLAAELRARITSGEWLPGTLLPPEARLSHEYGVGRGTVRRAVAELRREGLIDAAPGRGTQVREQIEREPVRVQRGSQVVARMPSPEERASLDIPEGVPVLIVTIGGRSRVLSAERTVLTFA
ncbi:GntR family transcriptional regulator [Plantactinospora sp. ZYX-F-223]|uniref:GntR family transcriptional regulator n=1 Tax=Plantactinospora sp. ZYX-F-223 TaxID=3144103 RepID=UPI0031FE22A7